MTDTPPTRVVHRDDPDCEVYIGRGSPWGNPWSTKPSRHPVTRVATVEQAINSYAAWVVTQPHLMAMLPSLRGKALGCFCKQPARPDAPCHGDVLATLADGGTWTPLHEPQPAQTQMDLKP